MEHICKHCTYWESFGYPMQNSGNCLKLGRMKKDSGEIPEDFISADGKDEQGNPIREGSVMGASRGVSTGAEYGKDCEYFNFKK
jgi:hypothetical protein